MTIRAAPPVFVLVIAILLGASASPGAVGTGLRCQYVESGPAGDAGNELRIQAEPFTIIVLERVEDRIRVAIGEEDEPELNVDCEGPTPTVHNIDSIRLAGGVRSNFVNPELVMDLSQGPFAPGATGEGPGNSEIEVYAPFKGNPLISVYGQDLPESYDFGVASRTLTVNLNQGEPQPDQDLFIRRPFGAYFAGAGGADLMDAAGVPGRFNVRLSGEAGNDILIGPRGIAGLSGGDGDDRIIGGPGFDFISGGSGDDLISSGKRRDVLRAGGGEDELISDGGEDRLYSADGSIDILRCGKRHDEATVDPSDRHRSCEELHRRR